MPGVTRVRCKLPQGYTWEFGTAGKDGYRVFHIQGITQVPSEFATRWFRDNAKLRYVRDGSIAIVP